MVLRAPQKFLRHTHMHNCDTCPFLKPIMLLLSGKQKFWSLWVWNKHKSTARILEALGVSAFCWNSVSDPTWGADMKAWIDILQKAQLSPWIDMSMLLDIVRREKNGHPLFMLLITTRRIAQILNQTTYFTMYSTVVLMILEAPYTTQPFQKLCPKETSWWFQPLWKIWVKMGIFPKVQGGHLYK